MVEKRREVEENTDGRWMVYAVLSAVFAALTSILAKVGMTGIDSNLGTAIRTGIVLIMAWVIVLMKGKQKSVRTVDKKELLFLFLSGIATGASWLCYFRALQLGDVNKVVPIDKSSTILTILLALIFLGEPITWLGAIAVVSIGVGTFLMIEKKAAAEQPGEKRGKKGVWLIYAVLSAVFASLCSILGKIGIAGVESNLGTAIRTGVVLVMAWLIVFMKGKLFFTKA